MGSRRITRGRAPAIIRAWTGPTAESPPESLARSRTLPLLAGYWSFGQFWGVWVILVLEFQQDHGLTDGRLGLLYSILSLSAIATMLAVAPRLQGLSLRASVPLSLASLAVAALALAVQPTSVLVLTFLLVGVGNGLIDVYLNVAGQREEMRTRRPVLQWLHASYALGGVTGAAAAGLLLTVGVDHRVGLAAAGVALLATAAWNRRRASPERTAEGASSVLSVSALRRSPALWIPALTILFCFLVEGSMDIWSGLYLREELGRLPGGRGGRVRRVRRRPVRRATVRRQGPVRARPAADDHHRRHRRRDRRRDRGALGHDAGRGRRVPPDGVRAGRGGARGLQPRRAVHRRSVDRDRGGGDRRVHGLRLVTAAPRMDRGDHRPAGGDGRDRARDRRDHGDRALRPQERAGDERCDRSDRSRSPRSSSWSPPSRSCS